MLPSWDFLPIAERSGRTLAIDRWVLTQCLAVLSEQCAAQPGLELLIHQHSSTPERLNALVRRLREQQTEVIAAGLDDLELIGPVWASGVRYAQGTLIQPPLAQPCFDWDGVVVG